LFGVTGFGLGIEVEILPDFLSGRLGTDSPTPRYEEEAPVFILYHFKKKQT